MRKIQSGGVTVSKRPLNYSDLGSWKRTMTCYSGILAYRFMFLDAVSTHLRLEYEFDIKSRILLEKNTNFDTSFNATKLSKSQLFNIKSTLLRNKVNSETLISGYLATDYYTNIKDPCRLLFF